MKYRSKGTLLCMLVLVIVGLPIMAGCGGKATGSSSSPSSVVSSPPPVSVSPTPTATISSELSAKASRLVARLFALVQDKKYAEARALIASPDEVWALSDMKRVKRIRLIEARLFQTSTPQLIVLLTTVERSPKTVTGASDWPNVVKIAVDPATGELTIVEFDTGP